MAKRGRQLAREAEMRAVLAKWERSDLPLSRFAKREGVAVKTLYRWRRRLGVGDDLVRRGRPPGRAEDASLFTEVSIASQPASVATNMFEGNWCLSLFLIGIEAAARYSQAPTQIVKLAAPPLATVAKSTLPLSESVRVR